ncbi:hypothetical protein D3C75_1183800 [compost metagenome]
MGFRAVHDIVIGTEANGVPLAVAVRVFLDKRLGDGFNILKGARSRQLHPVQPILTTSHFSILSVYAEIKGTFTSHNSILPAAL